MAKRKPVRLVPSSDVDDRIIASSLMLAILSKAGLSTPAELSKALAAGDEAVMGKLSSVVLDDEQIDILDREATAASYTRIKDSASVIVCLECGEWLTSATAVSKCQMTSGCPGRKDKIVKAKKATQKPIEEEEA